MKDLMGPSEAAKRLGVSTRTVQRWLREGRLPGVQVGSHIKVDTGALEPPVPTGARPIRRLLVANRGELVVRIARTCRQLGITCIALVAEDQARAWWTSAADEIVPLRGSYLDAGAVLAAARAARADAIHPGYGFLAENADFATSVLAADLIWVGPPPAAMRALGDKAAARRLAVDLGVPVLSGYDGDDQSDARLATEAASIGFPVLVKPSAGGGGKGMHVLATPDDAAETLARARREAKVGFDDDRLILERYLSRPRHIEIQILADTHGHAIHLGERECSLQRRHQKVIEEAPSPAVDERLRARLGEAALALVRAAGYQGAGTAEFLLDTDGSFYFLEVNARLQVEHPVTELVTGRDLVADQLSIAAGAALSVSQSDVRFDGHAIEARLYAEDPFTGFVPATGEAMYVKGPEGVRVDFGIGAGDFIGTKYDPLLAKLVAHGRNRSEALDALRRALDETTILGLTTNRGFLAWLVDEPDVRRGETYTTLIDERWHPREELPDEAWSLAARAIGQEMPARTGFRLNAQPRLRVDIDGETRTMDEAGRPASRRWIPLMDGSAVFMDIDGRAVPAGLAPAPTVDSAARHATHDGTSSAQVTAPMPGTVLAVRVKEGDLVEAGQVLTVLEAMKMENTVPAPTAGRVASVLVKPGDQVKRSQPLVTLI